MNILEHYENVTHGPWITIGLNVQYRVVGDTLYFQATKTISDWAMNLIFVSSVYKNSSVTFRTHRGFKKLWLSIKPEIEKLEFKRIVGYSQGAALAGFAHENFFHRKGYEPETFVFGCPNFLWNPNKELLSRFTQFYRFKNPTDIVTTVPPRLFGYKAPGNQTVLHAKNIIKPKNVCWLMWITGHSSNEYRLRLRHYI